jgi:large subunit ribosomal protein L23
MAILDRFKKKPKTASAEKPAKKPAAKKAPAKTSVAKTADASKAEAPKVASKASAFSNALLRMPHVSEKAARLADKGTYVFRVPMRAEKVSIKKAVESMYGVHVDKVRIISTPGKPVRRGKRVSYRQDQKKALVTLKKGETIALYEGV